MTIYLKKKASNEAKKAINKKRLQEYEEEMERYRQDLTAYENYFNEKQLIKSILNERLVVATEPVGQKAIFEYIDAEVKRICDVTANSSDN